MTIRIIGGAFGGRKLRSVAGRTTRPLLGQVREALFNILGSAIDDAVVWDLFAGTGVNGIEALSRGAARVVFVEKANGALKILRDNLEAVGAGVTLDFEVVKGDAWDPRIGGSAPDVVFYDPPYKTVAEDPTRAVARAGALAERLARGGRLLFHFPEGVLDADDFDGIGETDLRCWGTSAVAIVRATSRP